MHDYETEFGVEEKARKKKFVNFKELIIYEDDHIIIINKPRGFTSIPERWETGEPYRQTDPDRAVRAPLRFPRIEPVNPGKCPKRECQNECVHKVFRGRADGRARA